jgi:hypothetical protein
MTINGQTGEVTESLPSRMPPEIAAAIIKVMKAAKLLGFDERNHHGGYNYVSIDKFLEVFRPPMAEAGLFAIVNEVEVAFRDGAPNKDGKITQWAMPIYEVWLFHESGASWGPLRRHLAIPMTGPQTFAASGSFIQKALMRMLFMVPTGEKDADQVAPEDSGPRVTAFDPRRLAGENAPASRARPAVAQASPSRDVAVAVYSRIRSDIRNATSLDRLNKTGIYGPDASADYDAIRSQGEGEKAWQALVDLDAQRRLELAGVPDNRGAAK